MNVMGHQLLYPLVVHPSYSYYLRFHRITYMYAIILADSQNWFDHSFRPPLLDACHTHF